MKSPDEIDAARARLRERMALIKWERDSIGWMLCMALVDQHPDVALIPGWFHGALRAILFSGLDGDFCDLRIDFATLPGPMYEPFTTQQAARTLKAMEGAGLITSQQTDDVATTGRYRLTPTRDLDWFAIYVEAIR